MEKSAKKLSSDKLPKKNILVLSCIDLRLTDELVAFLNKDNLQNRYDHFILAGASLLCTKDYKNEIEEEPYKNHERWYNTLLEHINIAIDLHKISDVYIVEHQDCGAYTHFIKNGKGKFLSIEEEKEGHKKFAVELAARIYNHERPHKLIEEHKNKKDFKVIEETFSLGVHCFFIDLRGEVELLYTKKGRIAKTVELLDSTKVNNTKS
ncbi:hypothetical protein GCM10028807_39360 [Spirosoma daeguense]